MFYLNILFLIFLSFCNYKENNNFKLVSDEYNVPNIIWLFWEGPLNNLTKSSLHHLKQNIYKYKIIYLNTNTIKCYYNSSDIPDILHTLPFPNQGDYFRFNLLREYGGIWMDASTYVKNDEVFDELIKEMNEKKPDMLAFNFYYYPQNNIELGVILSPMNSEFINKVLNIYVYGLRTGREELMKRMINEGMILNSPHQYRIDKDTGKPFYSIYFFSYYCVQYILQIEYKGIANILLKRAEDWSYKFQWDCAWEFECMNKNWNDKEVFDKYKIIKYTGGDRRGLKVYFDGDV